MKTVVHFVAVGGLSCTITGVIGLLYSLEQGGTRSPPATSISQLNLVNDESTQVAEAIDAGNTASEIASSVNELAPLAADGAETGSGPVEIIAADPTGVRQAVQATPPATDRLEVSFYPLEVGRYWVYKFYEGDEVDAQIVRTIERSESRDGRLLFFFDDGTVAYEERGRVFEMGADSGLNVVPVEPLGDGDTPAPYSYRSQGLLIKKRIGASDTTIVVGSTAYERCLEVITAFRTEKGGPRKVISYSSFYAPEIGLIARERWSGSGVGPFSLELQAHGFNTSATQL